MKTIFVENKGITVSDELFDTLKKEIEEIQFKSILELIKLGHMNALCNDNCLFLSIN